MGWYIEYLSQRHLYEQSPSGGSNLQCCVGGHPLVSCGSGNRNGGTRTPENTDESGDEQDDVPYLIALSEYSDAGSDVDESEPGSSCILEAEEAWRDTLVLRLTQVLTECQPFPGDGNPVDPTYRDGGDRVVIAFRDQDTFEVYDRVQGFETHLAVQFVQWERFSVGKWFAERCAANSGLPRPWAIAQAWLETRNGRNTSMGFPALRDNFEYVMSELILDNVELSGIQVDRNKYPSLQRNSAHIKDNSRILPRPVVVKVEINGHPARALLDSGSLGDFISSTLVDQLSVHRDTLSPPLSLHLAVQGSRSKVNARATVSLKYQGINETRTLDIININNYDMILGTPWMWQHKVCIGFNPARVVVGSDIALPLKAGFDTKLMVSMLSPDERRIASVREELRQYADPLCKEMEYPRSGPSTTQFL